MHVLVNAVAMRKEGGGSRHLYGLTQALSAYRDDTFTICVHSSFSPPFSAPNLKYRPCSVQGRLRRIHFDQVVLPRIAGEINADVAVALLVFGMFHPPIPQVAMARNPQYYCRRLWSRMPVAWRAEMTLRRAAAYRTIVASNTTIVPSDAMASMILACHPRLNSKRLVTIPHALELGQLELTGSAQAVTRPSGPVLLYVSHLEEHKDVPLAVDIIGEIHRTHPNAQLWITVSAQDWPDGYKKVEQAKARLARPDAVVNLGRVPQGRLAEIYRSADVFLFPSFCESFGFPLMEALGYGLPVVASDTPINREICGDVGLHFQPGNASEGGAAALRVLGDSGLRARMRRDSRARYSSSHLTWKEYASRWTDELRRASAH